MTSKIGDEELAGPSTRCWLADSASAVGTAHAERGDGCDDAAECIRLDDGAIAFALADGASSATNGGRGARIAVQSALAWLNESGAIPLSGLTEEVEAFFKSLVAHVRETLGAEAQQREQPLHDFMCTLMVCAMDVRRAIGMNLGDGFAAIAVIDAATVLGDQTEDNSLEAAIVVNERLWLGQSKGEFANQAWMVTSEGALDHIVIGTADRPFVVVASTDGLERAALDISRGTIHRPFFEPLLRWPSLLTDAQAPDALATLLATPSIVASSRDDLTIVLCGRADQSDLFAKPISFRVAVQGESGIGGRKHESREANCDMADAPTSAPPGAGCLSASEPSHGNTVSRANLSAPG